MKVTARVTLTVEIDLPRDFPETWSFTTLKGDAVPLAKRCLEAGLEKEQWRIVDRPNVCALLAEET